MNKKGFTLIEILAVIVIIAILLVLVTPNILARLSKTRGDVSEATEKVIKDAARVYIDDNPDVYPENEGDIYCITVETLISEGKLVDPLIDAETGKEIDKKTSVRVTITKNGREYELVTDGTCDQGKDDSLKSSDIKLEASNITTKGFDVKTTVNNYDISNIASYDYSIDNGKTYEYKNKTNFTRITNLITNTYPVKVKIKTRDGQVVVSKTLKVTLDVIGNITFSSSPVMNVCAKSKTVTVTNPTQKSAGVAKAKGESLRYSYTLDASIDKSRWKNVSNASTKYKVLVTESGTMMARVTDGVNEKVVSYALTKIAYPDPEMISASVDTKKEKYYAGRITLKGRLSVCKTSATKIAGYCLTKTNKQPSANDKCFSETDKHGTNATKGVFGRDNGTYYAWVKDNANQVSRKGYKVKVNWTGKPSCSISDSGNKGNNGWYIGNVTTTLNVNTANKTKRSSSISKNKVTSNGTTTVTGKVAAGGKSASCSKTVKIDKVKPSCSGGSTGSGGKTPSVWFTCSDSTSGCTQNYSSWYIDKTGYFSHTFYDRAGHSCTANSGYVVKYVPPALTLSCWGDCPGRKGGCTTNKDVTWTVDLEYPRVMSKSCSKRSCTITIQSGAGGKYMGTTVTAYDPETKKKKSQNILQCDLTITHRPSHGH